MKKTFSGLFMILALLVLLSVPVQAQQTMSGNSVEQTSQAKYKIKKVKTPIYMLYHEKRVIIPNVYYDTVIESDNTRVLQVANNGLAYGRKAGKANVTVTDGDTKTIYKVEVRDTVDLILFAGQSNMYGTGGSYGLAPSVPEGQAYEYDIQTKSKTLLMMREPFGRGKMKGSWYSSGEGYSNQGTIASAFSTNYFKQTKTPIVGVFAAWGGISTQRWLSEKYMKESVNRLKDAKKFLKKKKIKIGHIYVVWYQGESDAMFLVDQDTYIKNMKAIQKKYKAAGAEQMMVIRIGNHRYDGNMMKNIAAAQVKLCQKDKNFTLVSKVAASLSNGTGTKDFHADALHINQYGLNKIGYEAGTNAGKYAKKHPKKK